MDLIWVPSHKLSLWYFLRLITLRIVASGKLLWFEIIFKSSRIPLPVGREAAWTDNPSNLKQRERAARFASLPASYHTAFTAFDKSVINKPIGQLVQEVQNSSLAATDVLRTYGKVAVKAQEKTNCVTELLLPEAERWAQSEVNLKGPLAGVPISLKDSVQVKGFDITLGYTRLAGKPYQEDGPMVKLLKDAGTSLGSITSTMRSGIPSPAN